MSNFIIGLDKSSIAEQIATLLNSNNQLKQHYTYSKVLASEETYLLELDGYNIRHTDNKRKLIGVVGLLQLEENVTLIKHLCVDNKYRNKGVATSLLKQALSVCETKYVQMRVRSDNIPSLNFAEKLGFLYIYHETMAKYHILVLGRIASDK
ncbi:MAG: GNAT family N-acetyltransferase [Sulfurimonas sp.]|jgi:RimJ/RimL family protein N-acetyltransferase|nr:GNAT family N-acetyltransferase [Sulfurimonas sp.]